VTHTGIALSGGGGSTTFWGTWPLLLLADAGGRSDAGVLRQPRQLYHNGLYSMKRYEQTTKHENARALK
jgi:hypothetical protein